MSYYTSNTKAPVDKGRGMWSRMKDFGSVNMSMSALSVSSSSDQDGDSETSTVIHQSLVKFYATKTGQVPEWLEPPGSEHTDLSQYQNQNQNNPYGQQQPQQQSQYSKRPSTASAPSCLQDIYARRGSSAEVNRAPQQQQSQYKYPQQQQYGQQQYGGHGGGQTAYGRPANGGSAGNGNPGNDRMREKLRQLGRSQSQTQGGASGEPAWRR
ncbi:hypothetical protein CKK34_5612 [Yarrowia sp. E02]|nr:hypothetical protein CKK34_5612 [Yarrowia sp. E02]